MIRRYNSNGRPFIAPRLRAAACSHGDLHRVYAIGPAPERVRVPITEPSGWREAQAVWTMLDDDRRAGAELSAAGVPVDYLAVRSGDDPGWPTSADTVTA